MTDHIVQVRAHAKLAMLNATIAQLSDKRAALSDKRDRVVDFIRLYHEFSEPQPAPAAQMPAAPPQSEVSLAGAERIEDRPLIQSEADVHFSAHEVGAENEQGAEAETLERPGLSPADPLRSGDAARKDAFPAAPGPFNPHAVKSPAHLPPIRYERARPVEVDPIPDAPDVPVVSEPVDHIPDASKMPPSPDESSSLVAAIAGEGAAAASPSPATKPTREQQIRAVMADHDDWHVGQIAEHLGCSIGAVSGVASIKKIVLPKRGGHPFKSTAHLNLTRSLADVADDEISAAAPASEPVQPQEPVRAPVARPEPLRLTNRVRIMMQQHPTWTARMIASELGAKESSVATLMDINRRAAAKAEPTPEPAFAGEQALRAEHAERRKRLGARV